MATHLAEAELTDPRVRHGAATRIPAPDYRDDTGDGDQTNPVRGIRNAILISIPFWALVALTLYLLR
jgi:hypothetical protein